MDNQAGVEGSYSNSPLIISGGIALSDPEKDERTADRGSVSAGNRTFDHASYRDGCRDARILLLKPCQRTTFNQP